MKLITYMLLLMWFCVIIGNILVIFSNKLEVKFSGIIFAAYGVCFGLMALYKRFRNEV